MDIVEYKNYGRCARFERNGVAALVTLDLGPRIIFYGRDGENFLNEDLDRNVSKGGEYFDSTYKKGEKWFLYGGHRVWKSPEDMESYTPDNYPVEADCSVYGGRFVTRAGKNFDYAIEVSMDPDGGLNVTDSIINKSDETRSVSVWALTVAAKGGTLIVPLNEPCDNLNPYQNLVQWPYNDLKDERVFFGKKYLAVRQTAKKEALKLGLFSEKRRAYYVVGDKAIKIDYSGKNGVFGDFWCNFETYTNEFILEVEGLSERYLLKKGETASFEEKWSVIGGVKLPAVINDDTLDLFV